MNKSIITLITSFIIGFTNVAYGQLATGQWQAHLSYVEGQHLAVSSNKIYCVASGNLFSYGLTDNAIETYSKVTGLSDVYIQDIAFCKSLETLVISYENGNIDLLDADGITNIPDLKQKAVYGSKKVNAVDVIGEYAYVCTDLGALKINIAKAEVSETYKFSLSDQNPVKGIAILEDKIYAATADGLYVADVNNINLQNFAAWKKVNNIGDTSLGIYDIAQFSDHIIIAQRHASGYYIKAVNTQSTWKQINAVGTFFSLGTSEEQLLIACNSHIEVHNSQLAKLKSIISYNFDHLDFASQNSIKARHAIALNSSKFCIADRHSGLVIYEDNAATIAYAPDGPATNTIWDIDINNNIVRTVHGSLTPEYAFERRPGAISTFRNSRWTSMDERNTDNLPVDLVSIESNPNDPDHFFASSWIKGIIEIKNDIVINHFLANNSSIEEIIGWPGMLVVPSIKIVDDNLWAINNFTNSRFHVLENINNDDRKWSAFTLSAVEADHSLIDFVITNDGDKWGALYHKGKGLTILDDNNSYDDTSDDKSIYFSVNVNDNGISKLFSEKVYSIEIDNDDNIWVGTDKGLAVFYNASNVFETNASPLASRILIPRNDGTGLADYLLDGVEILSIAVDGGNRKWFATTDAGVILVSPDGQQIIQHFTKDNSPLLSNYVRKVKINNDNGTVYFATDAGLVSYRSDATSGEFNYDNIKAFPNPVRENYFGDITIVGLIEETLVKITDVSGNLVNQTSSQGGTAIWDGTNFNGQRVGSGVYIIFCSDKEGLNSGMTKVMVIN